MPSVTRFRAELARCQLIAIIRGVTPDICVAIGKAILSGGISVIEVPLNTPEALECIDRLSRSLGGEALIGAGTVLDAKLVPLVHSAGGELIVSPNINADVIGASVAAGLASIPGFFTPSEAFAGIAAGAHALKFFPAEAGSPAALRAQKAVLPKDMPILPVGGITPETIPQWLAAGADGFGVGSTLFSPGMTADDVFSRARGFVQAMRHG